MKKYKPATTSAASLIPADAIGNRNWTRDKVLFLPFISKWYHSSSGGDCGVTRGICILQDANGVYLYNDNKEINN